MTSPLNITNLANSSAWNRWRMAAVLALAATCYACSDSTDHRITVFPVSGKVLFNGQPAAGAQVLLFPKGHALPDGSAATGIVKDDGTFQASIYSDGSGVPPGEYVVTVQWFKLVQTDGGAGRGPNVIPARYGDPEKSPVKVTVAESGQTTIEPIEIKS